MQALQDFMVCPDSTSFFPLSILFTPQGWAYLVVRIVQWCQLWGVKPGIVPLQCSDPGR